LGAEELSEKFQTRDITFCEDTASSPRILFTSFLMSTFSP